MRSARFELRLPHELVELLDAVRGFESRASFMRRALERALEAESSGSAPVPSPAGREAETEAAHERPDARAAASLGASGPAASPRAPAFNRVASLERAARPVPRRS